MEAAVLAVLSGAGYQETVREFDVFCLYIVPSSEESISCQSSWKTYCVYEI